MDEYDTRQLQEVENLFPEESRVPLLAVSAEKKERKNNTARMRGGDIPMKSYGLKKHSHRY